MFKGRVYQSEFFDIRKFYMLKQKYHADIIKTVLPYINFIYRTMIGI